MTEMAAKDLSRPGGVRLRPGAPCVVLVLLALAGQAVPAAGDADQARDDESMLEGVMSWVDRQHSQLSGRVAASALAIDRFFATEEYLEDTSDSYIQLVSDLRYDTRADSSGDIKLRGRLDLPGTRRRFSLLISGVTDEWLGGGDPLADTSGEGALTLERNPRADVSGWQIRPGAGVRGGWPPEPFVRLRATRHVDLGEGWATRTQGLVRYLVDDKWDLRGDFNLLKTIDERWTARARTDLGWREIDDFARAGQSFDLFGRISDRVGLRHTLSVSGDDQADWRVASYGYRFSWRRLIHSDWLYMEISPEVYFPREHDFEATGAVQLRLEAFAGDYR